MKLNEVPIRWFITSPVGRLHTTLQMKWMVCLPSIPACLPTYPTLLQLSVPRHETVNCFMISKRTYGRQTCVCKAYALKRSASSMEEGEDLLPSYYWLLLSWKTQWSQQSTLTKKNEASIWTTFYTRLRKWWVDVDSYYSFWLILINFDSWGSTLMFDSCWLILICVDSCLFMLIRCY